MKNPLFGKSLISVDDISATSLFLIFERAKIMRTLVTNQGGDDRLKGKILAALFFEPSTRTFSSFITAMQRLGGGIIPNNGMKNTSIEKGESFEHTIRVFSTYADCLVVRHPLVGKPKQASEVSSVPVINAGDGIGEHPSQAIYDVFTILERFPAKKDLVVSLIGDLKNGRTVHSLTKTLLKLPIKIKFNFISPQILVMHEAIKKEVSKKGASFIQTDDLYSHVKESNVLYVTRVQKERFTDLKEYDRVKDFYKVNEETIKNAKKNMIIMHPLPIAVGEIDRQLDDNPHSLYLKDQLKNGLFVRMALLDLILRK